MIDIESYISKLICRLRQQYGARLLYVGLQGSYLRGEATVKSDIDIMVVIDSLNVPDLDAYRNIISDLEHADKSCGFICSKTDLLNWNPLEICHLINSTKDYYGALNTLIPAYTEADIRDFIKLSINNLYHEICHRYIHAGQQDNITELPRSYKSVFFILQSLYYLEGGKYILSKADLLPLLTSINHEVLLRSIQLNGEMTYDFPESFELLFKWCQNTLSTL